MKPTWRIPKTGLWVLALTGCGGGGGGGQDPADLPGAVPASVIRGHVLDGPLVGAKVCLDINSNWVCDKEEPAATSSANGAFALDIAPRKPSDIQTLPVIAEVGPDALDEATGMTLRAAGSEGYVLASWGGERPVLSPINTLVAIQRLYSGYHPQMDTVNVVNMLTEAGLSTTPEHYFDAAAPLTVQERERAKSTGRVLASLLASAQAKLIAEANAVYAADRARLGSRASELVIQALRNTRPATASETEAEALSRMQAATRLVSITAATEGLAHKATTALAAEESLARLSEGLMDLTAVGSSPRGFMRYKRAADTGRLMPQRFRYIGAQWQTDTSNAAAGAGGQHLIAERKTPGQSSEFIRISTLAPSVSVDGSRLVEEFIEGSRTQAHELIVLSRDVSELPFNAFPELGSIQGFFPKGQSGFFLRRKSLVSEYLFDHVATFFTTLSQFRRSPQTCYEGICWSITQQATGTSAESAGRLTFRTTSSGGNLILGEGRFIEETVAGVNVLRMTSVPIEVQNRSAMWDAKDGRYLCFADIEGKLWFGKYIPEGTVWYSNPLVNLPGLNAVLASTQAQAYTP